MEAISVQNLERIEQRTLAHLRQSINPVVPVDALLAHLHDDDLLTDVSLPELLSFLRHHDLFRVFEIPRLVDGEVATGPAVVLESRIPTQREMLAHLFGELEKMEGALLEAVRQARADADLDKLRALNGLLDRLSEIRERIKAEAT